MREKSSVPASIRFFVPGEVRGKGRPRFVRATGRTYTPAKTVSYENLVAMAAREAMNGFALFAGPVSLSIVAAFQPAPSASKRKRAAMLADTIRPTKKPDADNVAKIADAMNGIVWRDDAQVVKLTVRKVYRETPGLDVEVSEVG